jgi:hypothetical protein
MPTSDSNLALVSDGEFVVNAAAATKNKALLQAINSGKAPKFSGSSQSAFLTHNAYSPTVNVRVEGNAADQQTAVKVAWHVNDAVIRRLAASATATRSSTRRLPMLSARRMRGQTGRAGGG